MTRRTVSLLVVGFALLAPVPAAADEAEWLFDPTQVAEIDLGLSPESGAALTADPDEYVEATFSVERADGTTYGPLTVGLRLKGSVSFRTLAGKAAFKLKFNEFVSGQKFQGLKKLTLNNMVQDATMVHELLSYEAFRRAGLAAPRAGYAYVRVNGDDYGVYLNLETPDSVMLKRSYPTTQHLYEGGYDVDVRASDIEAFEADEGDEDERGDLEALAGALDTWTGVDAVADLDQLVRFWAVEHYIGHWDGYSTVAAEWDDALLTNNYYLHSDADGRFTMLPWGTDQTFAYRASYSVPAGLMSSRCFADPACFARYQAAVVSVTDLLRGDELGDLATAAAALLTPWQAIDPRREHTLAQIQTGLVELHAFLAVRPSDTPWSAGPAPAPFAPSARVPAVTVPAVEIDPPAPVDLGGLARLGSAPSSVGADAGSGASALSLRSVVVRNGMLVATVAVPGAGRLSTRATARLAGQRSRVCRTSQPVAGRGEVRARCALTRAARRRLRAGALRLDVSTHFLARSGPALSARRSFSARR